MAGLFTVIAFLSDGVYADANTSSLSYTIVEEWHARTGGVGRTILVNKVKPTESELRSLGEKLKQDAKGNAFVFITVYDDERAARIGRRVSSEWLKQPEKQHHDQHRVGLYVHNGETGADDFLITPDGADGPETVVHYGRIVFRGRAQ